MSGCGRWIDAGGAVERVLRCASSPPARAMSHRLQLPYCRCRCLIGRGVPSAVPGPCRVPCWLAGLLLLLLSGRWPAPRPFRFRPFFFAGRECQGGDAARWPNACCCWCWCWCWCCSSFSFSSHPRPSLASPRHGYRTGQQAHPPPSRACCRRFRRRLSSPARARPGVHGWVQAR